MMLGGHVDVRTPKVICGGCLAPALLDLATWDITDHTRRQTSHCHVAAACVLCEAVSLLNTLWHWSRVAPVAYQIIPGT